MLSKILILSVAGALGTLLRFGACSLVNRLSGSPHPFGTMAVNLSGCFMAGIAWAFFESRTTMPEHVRLAVLVGFMGAFTTFSAFMIDNGEMLKSSRTMAVIVNFGVQNALGFVALFAGAALVRHN